MSEPENGIGEILTHRLSISHFVIAKGPKHGARGCSSDAQKEYHTAHECLKKGEKKNNYETTLQRLLFTSTFKLDMVEIMMVLIQLGRMGNRAVFSFRLKAIAIPV